MSLMNLARIVGVFVPLPSLQSLMFDVTLQSTKSRKSLHGCDSTIERVISHLLSVSTRATAIPFLPEHRVSRSSTKEDLAVR